DQQRLQAAVIKVASGVSAATGTQFYEQLARNMAEALGARAGFVAELLPDDPGGARTIAAIVDGELTENFEYQLAGTPCASLLTTRTCVMAERVAEQFPHSPRLAALGAQAYAGQRLDSSDGRPLGLIFVVFQDPPRHIDLITSTLQIFAARAAAEIERQRTDAQVREQAALPDIAHEAILVKDMQGRIIFWNKGAERIYGWTAAEALGRDAVELLHDDAADFRAAHAALLHRNDWEGELTRRAKDGRNLVVQVRWTLVRDAHGAPKAIFAINSDVTEAKQLEAQFLRAQRTESIGTLASGIAHDLNHVLAPILMSVEMLKDMTVTEDDRDVLAMLQGSAQRGAELVRQVLTFARGVEGQRIVVNPLHVMRDLLRVMRDTFPKSVSLRFTAAPDLWSVTGDPTQLYQVFLNLCVNARDAMPDGGRLTIRMENAELEEGCGVLDPGAPRGAYVKVRIEDTGVGIPPHLRDRIFEPFFTTKGVGAGTGLGLSTTLAIVKSHGGCVQLSSEVGSGTTFTVYLAADAARAAAEEVEADETRLPRGNGELILVVDDEAAIRGIAQRALERFGYRVVLADNGAEAAVLYGRRHAEIAAVLTDMAMPVMDGAATIRAIRAVNPAARIIASSGLAQGVEVGAETGITHFISKPYTTERLLKSLRALLGGAPPVTH
ncbi:MAG TPA: ATP-binding protein, partial [Gemmatimonadaceae bacterium]|nr:ATP-binding protein [Gemmatimonadaceae bacterium]